MLKIINLIAPSAYITDAQVKKSLSNLNSLGYSNILFQNNITERDFYFAGSINRRIKELNFVLNRNNLVFCARGGYGCIELLPKIKLNSKSILIGNSDITALILGITSKNKSLIAIHGPMPATKNWPTNPKHLKYLLNCINNVPFEVPFENDWGINNFKETISGQIIGGNLRIITSLIGTDFMPNFKNKILFLEDVNENPAAIYNMLLHLKLSGKLDKVKLILLGKFHNCGDYEPFIELFIKKTKIPVITNMPLGHCKNMIPIKILSNVTVNINKKLILFNRCKKSPFVKLFLKI